MTPDAEKSQRAPASMTMRRKSRLVGQRMTIRRQSKKRDDIKVRSPLALPHVGPKTNECGIAAQAEEADEEPTASGV